MFSSRSGTTWSLQQELTAPDGVALDLFGYAVALSGDTLAVGALGRSDRGTSSGAVYVFVRTGTTWSLQQKIVPGDGAAGDNFGISVALDGTTLVSGAAGASSGGVATGTAYAYFRSGTTWSLQQKLVPSSGAAGDQFGSAVAVDATTNTAIVGAPQNGTTAPNAGAAFAFVRSGSAWSQQQTLVAATGAAGDLLGYSVGVQGNRAIASAYRRASNGTDSGGVYVFDRSGTAWSISQTITASDNASGDLFGFAVAFGPEQRRNRRERQEQRRRRRVHLRNASSRSCDGSGLGLVRRCDSSFAGHLVDVAGSPPDTQRNAPHSRHLDPSVRSRLPRVHELVGAFPRVGRR
jgi:hypothetical protein